ncbi:MAG: PIN domain-containing protein [Acidobacteriota bacterium]
MAKTFVDSSFWVALADSSDQWHKPARKSWRAAGPLLTTTSVIDETISLLQWRGQLSFALEYLDKLRTDENLLIVYPDADTWAEGWRFFRKYGGSGAGAVDCLSFAVMRRFGLKRALTFDAHFRVAGFSTL